MGQGLRASLDLIEEPLRSVVKEKTDTYLEWMAEPYALVEVDLVL